ncbi:MAG: glycosyltransferase family protein [Methanotrichaceae archaeon]
MKLLEKFSEERPMNLVLPLACREMERRTLPRILSELNKDTFLSNVIVALYAPSREEFAKVVRFFRRLEIPHKIMWCNSPNINAILDDLQMEGIDIKIQGKGRDCWLALGVASMDSYAIVMHDADIVNYSYELPMKLVYPLVDPDLDYFFNKGYYARIGGDYPRFYGRTTRLFVRPLLDALMIKANCSSDFLRYLYNFKYPLSGEIALTSDLALNIRMPMDWGLEIGTLYEIYRSVVKKRICQTDLGFFEHMHQEVGLNRSEGLLKMAGDILITLLKALIEEEMLEVSSEFLNSLWVMYRRKAQDIIKQYYADSVCNHLSYNRHEEESMVEAFEWVIMQAGQEFIDMPKQAHIPDWRRASSAIPKLRKKFIDSILEDEKSVWDS